MCKNDVKRKCKKNIFESVKIPSIMQNVTIAGIHIKFAANPQVTLHF